MKQKTIDSILKWIGIAIIIALVLRILGVF